VLKHNYNHTWWATKVCLCCKLASRPISSPNVGRFSKFCHWHILRKICNNKIIKYSTTSYLS